MDSSKTLTEFELIRRLTADEPKSSSGLIFGVGDDCAIVEGAGDRDWLVTTDALCEPTHFRREWIDLKVLGRKAVAVNLSDIAAMGGTPRFYVASLGLPPDMSFEDSDQLYSGMREMAGQYDMILIGGDTFSCVGGLFLSITVLGDIEKGRAILRSDAKADDAIYVTGSFGSSAFGLTCLASEKSEDRYKHFIERHNDPTPRLGIGSFLSETGLVNSMIDVSDGLLADLSHIADASDIGFEIDATMVPIEGGLRDVSGELGWDPHELALTGGEDYELIFTVESDKVPKFESKLSEASLGVEITRIGIMKGDKSVRRVLGAGGDEITFRKSGYDHLKG